MSVPRAAFLSLSAHLTGFDQTDLLATGMLDEYFQYVLGKVTERHQEQLWTLSTRFDQLRVCKDENVLTAEIQQSLLADLNLGPIAKNIIRLWYTGNWRNVASDPFSGEVASGRAYQEGLVWKVIHSHPPGAKQPGFGSWNRRPQ